MSTTDPQTESNQEAPRPPDRRGQGLQNSVPSTRTSVSWTFVAIAIVALVIVLVFILENLHATDATFFGIHWRIPLGLDLLLAALLGAAAVFVIGAARTLQLRLLAHRTMRARDARVPSTPAGADVSHTVTTVDNAESTRGPDHHP
jgi:uncharacterized integral membrane protein